MLPPNPMNNYNPGVNGGQYNPSNNGYSHNQESSNNYNADVLASKMAPMSISNSNPQAYYQNQQSMYNGMPQGLPQQPPQMYPSSLAPVSQAPQNQNFQYTNAPTLSQVPNQPPMPNMPNFPPAVQTSSNSQFPQMPQAQPYPNQNIPTMAPGPGFPGQPGAYAQGAPQNVYGQMPPNMGPPGAPPTMYGQMPQRKINPDLMPSAIEVIENDRSIHSGQIFETGNRGVAPPLVTTDFSCRDQGNCNPRFVRSSLYAVPNTSDLLKSCGLPFTITCCPFAELHPNDQPVMLSDMGTLGPVRCIRCKAYMSPVMSFIDGGRKFNCQLCGGTTEVPADYFAHIDHTGRRTDTYQRPELCVGSYELTTTKDYCRSNKLPNPPAFIFLIDVSQSALRSGMVSLFCSRFVSEILPNLPKDHQAELQYRYLLQNYEDQIANGNTPQTPKPEAPKSQISVGFITYDRHLHFYSFIGSKTVQKQNGEVPNGTPGSQRKFYQPRMNIIADTEEMFVPGVEGFLIPGDDEEAIQSLLDLIPQYFMGEGAPNPSPDPLLAPAIQAGMEALKASERPGKLFILHSSLPTVEAPGRLKNRDDRKLIGTEKEKTLLTPVNDFYTNLGKQCIQNGCSVDLFLMPVSYIDIATISEVPKYTGGHLYKYNCFLAETHGVDLINDLRNAICNAKAFDCVMRVRTSAGTRPVEFLGNCDVPNTTDVEVSAMDQDWALAVEIKHDDKLPEGDVVFIQVAVLYTSLNGQRRLRIHNLSLNTTNRASELFRLSDLDSHVNWLAKSTTRSILVRSGKQVLEDLSQKVAVVLAAYRKHCSSQQVGQGSTNPGELILPETLKLLPLFAQSILKSDIVRPANEIAIDDRSLILFLVISMNAARTVAYFYPRVLPIHNLNLESEDIPVAIRCSYDRLQDTGAYLLDNGVNLFLWLGSNVAQDWLQAVFNVGSIQQLQEGAQLIERDNDISKRVNGLVRQVRFEHARYCRLIVTKQGDRSEMWLKHFMLEDRAEHCPSYVDYLCHIHREVRSQLK